MKKKKITSLNRLRELIRIKNRLKYPNIPERHLPEPNVYTSSKPEKRELKRIVAWINASGDIAKIVDNKGIRMDNRKSYTDTLGHHRIIGSVNYRPSDIPNGWSDIEATINGRTVYIELKREYKVGKDRQSVAQKEFQKRVEAAGAVYIIVSSFENFITWWDNR